MSFTRIQIYQLSLLFCYIQQCYSACYRPNGTMVGIDPDGGAYVPCDIDGGMCCALGRPSTSRFVDYCRSDGLCESPGSGDVYRESCSDPTWKDPRCLKLCVDEADGSGYSTKDVHVTPCGDGSYCCGNLNTTCCDNKLGVWIVNGTVTDQKPASVAAISTWTTPVSPMTPTSSVANPTTVSSAITTSSSTASATPIPSSTSSAILSSTLSDQTQQSSASSSVSSTKPLPTSTVAGIGIGTAIICCTCIAIVFIYWKRSRLPKPSRDEKIAEETLPLPQSPTWSKPELLGNGLHEMWSGKRYSQIDQSHELLGTPSPVEMPARDR